MTVNGRFAIEVLIGEVFGLENYIGINKYMR